MSSARRQRAGETRPRRRARGTGPLSVLIADDQAEVRSALRLIVEQLVGYRVVAEATTAEELLEVAASGRPDVVLLDWELPEHRCERPVVSLRALVRLHERVAGVRVVALSARDGARAEALEGGADAFVSKCDPPRRLIETLDRLW